MVSILTEWFPGITDVNCGCETHLKRKTPKRFLSENGLKCIEEHVH